MKRHIPFIILSAALLFALSGCGNGILASRRSMEHLRPVQTIGLDRTGNGVELGVSAGPGPMGEAPLVIRCRASGIEPAIRRLQSYSPGEELFFAHVRYILLSPSMANDHILPLLDWVERSPSMRMDTRLILIRGSAADALSGAVSENGDVTDRLARLEREEKGRGLKIRSLREVASSLLERGCALCAAIETAPTEGQVVSGGGAPFTVVFTGYAVLRSGKEPAFLDPEETLGAALLTGGVNGAEAEIEGNVLDITSSGAKAEGEWDAEGRLTGLRIRCSLRAGVLEREEGGVPDTAALEYALSRAAEGWILAAAERAGTLACDFTCLAAAIEKTAPRGARTDTVPELVFSVPVTVTAEAVIDRSYDLTN